MNTGQSRTVCMKLFAIGFYDNGNPDFHGILPFDRVGR